jgi:putative thiamine transport system substrate-binding protein
MLASSGAAMVFGCWPGLARGQGFEAIQERARGTTVHFYAWGGSPEINGYIAWVGERVRARFAIDLVHVKVNDTAEAIAILVGEKAAGRESGGSIDLIWINGENFAEAKRRGLLFGPFAEDLPNYRWVDVEGKPTTTIDFHIPTEGYEAPWGMAQFVFLYDTRSVPNPPSSFAELFEWIRMHPGRFTHPSPPDFVGSTFLKHMLYLVGIPQERLAQAVTASTFAELADPVFSLLDALYPHFWRGGRAFPQSQGQLHQLLADGEVDFSMSFNPAEAANLILAGRLPASVRSFVPAEGTIANTHFVAIPWNAANRDGALVVADFLLSPEAQAKKADPAVWGDGTVLAVDRLPPEARALFEALPGHPAMLPPEKLRPARPEPHPDWMEALEQAWKQRYAS